MSQAAHVTCLRHVCKASHMQMDSPAHASMQKDSFACPVHEQACTQHMRESNGSHTPSLGYLKQIFLSSLSFFFISFFFLHLAERERDETKRTQKDFLFHMISFLIFFLISLVQKTSKSSPVTPENFHA